MFAVGMLAIAVFMGAIGLIGVRYRLHVESEKPLIFGAASAAFLILLESASYQLGTNLPVLSSVDLPKNRTVVYFEARDGLAVNANGGTATTLTPDGHWDEGRHFSQPFTISGNQLDLGAESPAHADFTQLFYESRALAARNERNPNVIYQIGPVDGPGDGNFVETLTVLAGTNGTPTTQGSPLELWRGHWRRDWNNGYLRVWHDRLYVVGNRTIVFDLSDPLRPKQLSNEPIKWTSDQNLRANEQLTIHLPPVPGMPATERLKFAVACDSYNIEGVFDGTIWCRVLMAEKKPGVFVPDGLLEDRLKSLTDDSAQFELIGKYTPTLVQYVVGGELGFSSLKIKDGLLYALESRFVNVFDLNGPRPLRLIGHFVAPSPSYLGQLEPLDDGRLIVGGDKLWLLGPPRR
jgi:hypothetical protein